MKTFLQINPKRILALVGLAGILGISTTAMAQSKVRAYANFQATNSSLTASVDAPENAINGNVHDSAQLHVTIGALNLLSATEYLEFTTDGTHATKKTITAGTPIYVKFNPSAGVLAVGGNIEIGTFTNLNTNVLSGWTANTTSVYTSANLASVLSGAGTAEIAIIPTTNCNGIYLKLASVLSLATTADLFHAYVLNDASGVGCPKPIDWLTGVAAGQLASVATATGSTVNPQSAIDVDPTYSTAATLSLGAQLISSSYYTAILNTPAKAGDSARVVLNNPNGGLLNLDVLSGLTIQAYNGSTPVGAAISSGSSLLKLQLLPGSTAKNIITAAIPGDYDRITITYGGLATTSGLLGNGNIDIYDIGSKVPAPVVTGALDKYAYKGNSVDLSTFATVNANGDPIIWKNLATGATVTSPFTATTSQNLVALSSRDNCSDASGLDTINLHVATATPAALPNATVGVPYTGAVVITADASGLPNTNPTLSYALVPGSVTMNGINNSLYNNDFGYIAMAAVAPNFAAGPMAATIFAGTPLANGLELNPNGTITGTPLTTAPVSFNVVVTDESNNLTVGTFPQTVNIDAALPVNLSSFVLNLDANKNVVLQWKTESEQNYIRFDVLRSNDGSKFTKIGDVKAAGNSTSVNNYKFVDQNPGLKSYYKLNIVTSDEGTVSSNVLSISGGKLAGFSISPNPASNNITITGIDNNDIASVNIYDASGRLVLTATEGSINVHALSAGIYFVTVVQKDGSKSNSKFLKK